MVIQWIEKGKKILKKFVMLMLVGVVSAASTTASAVSSFSDELARSADSSLAVANNATNGAVNIQDDSIGSDEVQGIVSQDTDQSDLTSPTTGWLLVLALIGFVMLSNRRGV